jgi:hypothetical protein
MLSEFAGDGKRVTDTTLNPLLPASDIKVQSECHEQKLISGSNSIWVESIVCFRDDFVLREVLAKDFHSLC